MELVTLIVIATFFVSSTIQGISGFGTGLIAVPILALVLPLTAVTPLISLQSICLSVFLVWKLRHHLQLSRFWPMIAAGVVFTPVGVYLLLVVNVDILKVALGFIVFLTAVALFLQFKANIPERKTTYAITGSISGTLNGLATLSGPPIVILLANQNVRKEVFRANISFYFVLVALVNIASLSSQSLVTIDTVQLALMALPTSILGVWLGSHLSGYINEALFKKFVVVLIGAAGLNLLNNGLSGIL